MHNIKDAANQLFSEIEHIKNGVRTLPKIHYDDKEF